MKKCIKRLYSKKGVTLVELIVVLFVSSILLGIAIGMLRPVTNLLQSIKGNAQMDTLCDTVNNYIRSSIDKAVEVSIFPYQEESLGWSAEENEYRNKLQDTIKNQWANFADKYKTSDGYELRALGILQNYNNDYRLFDFGDVSRGQINYSWGANVGGNPNVVLKDSNDGIVPGNAFLRLINFRDGGGRDRSWDTPPVSGVNGNEFGIFYPFNDSFYNNAAGDNANYSIMVAFESVGQTLDDGGTGVKYLTVSTQMFKRIGDKYSSDEELKNLKYEPANQMKSLSFNMLNGSVGLDASSATINKIETINGGKQIVPATEVGGKTLSEGVIILYVIRKDMSASPSKPPFETNGGGIYGGYYNGTWGTKWFGINDYTVAGGSQPPITIKNNSGSVINTKDVTIVFEGDFSVGMDQLSLNHDGDAKVNGTDIAGNATGEVSGSTYKVTLPAAEWKDGETLTIGKTEITSAGSTVVDTHGTVTVYVEGQAVWTKSVSK